MDKETEIREMAKIICGREFAGYALDCKKECNAKCSCGKIAEDLYNAGYRKADEVRKETAKEIALEINSMSDCVSAPEISLLLDILEMLKEEYGVGVDE